MCISEESVPVNQSGQREALSGRGGTQMGSRGAGSAPPRLGDHSKPLSFSRPWTPGGQREGLDQVVSEGTSSCDIFFRNSRKEDRRSWRLCCVPGAPSSLPLGPPRRESLLDLTGQAADAQTAGQCSQGEEVTELVGPPLGDSRGTWDPCLGLTTASQGAHHFPYDPGGWGNGEQPVGPAWLILHQTQAKLWATAWPSNREREASLCN